ncbi:PQQ-dependent sugar dehydrogenase [Fluviicola taffensis]|uniref:Quinoprotein glucose dehydrogenase n=1 Tax=Fluviicola taffensis (strain DSM 16823 / NCIMB 13979 / RW262) TaxID=755732 RepID=F2IGA6_FLUTR|nr:PQQ-dependent sugar dehydrogenase [Fluviicola taffensis]AEA45772.1 Quinoprotein glucose dehydrogenase [Fluviicola taffensis DSM 16823]
MEFKNLLFIVSCGLVPLVQAQTTQQIGSTTVTIDTLTSDVSTPWEIKVEGNTHLWVTERSGLVSRIDLTTGVKTVVLNLTSTVRAVSESGLLGMALHPDFENTPEVFLVYTYGTPDGQGFFKERLVKYTFNGTNLINPAILLDNILAWNNHNGSRLHFLPDNTLLMSTGECYEDQLAQDPNSLSGKYLRLNMDGSIPANNPTSGSYVYSLGHRNSQGICALPDGKILISEHGPSTDDELQILQSGKNYGWPLIHGFCDEPFENTPCGTGLYTEPIHAWTPTIATSDLVYYQNSAFPEWNNRVLMVTLNGQRVVAMELNATSTSVMDEDQYFQGQFGRLRDIAIGPNQEIYIATNSGDHSIIRITPPTTLGTTEFQTSLFSIFPNPSNTFIQLLSENRAEQVSILDLNGKSVLELKQVEQGTQIDISMLPVGMYSVEIKFIGVSEIQRQKFMKIASQLEQSAEIH